MEEKFSGMYDDPFRVVIPEVPLLFYGSVLVIPPQLRAY